MLMDKIRADMLDAKKAKNALTANLLSALYSEIFTLSKSGKDLSSEDEVKVIKKFLKNIDDTLNLNIPDDARQKYFSEKVILESYLPKQLSKEEIERIVTDLLGQNLNMGEVMKYFKENFPGRYDGKTVNEAVKSKMSNGN